MQVLEGDFEGDHPKVPSGQTHSESGRFITFKLDLNGKSYKLYKTPGNSHTTNISRAGCPNQDTFINKISTLLGPTVPAVKAASSDKIIHCFDYPRASPATFMTFGDVFECLTFEHGKDDAPRSPWRGLLLDPHWSPPSITPPAAPSQQPTCTRASSQHPASLSARQSVPSTSHSPSSSSTYHALKAARSSEGFTVASDFVSNGQAFMLAFTDWVRQDSTMSTNDLPWVFRDDFSRVTSDLLSHSELDCLSLPMMINSFIFFQVGMRNDPKALDLLRTNKGELNGLLRDTLRLIQELSRLLKLHNNFHTRLIAYEQKNQLSAELIHIFGVFHGMTSSLSSVLNNSNLRSSSTQNDCPPLDTCLETFATMCFDAEEQAST